MIESIVKDFLNTELDCPVLMEKPATNIPEEYVLLEKTSSGRVNLINTAMVAIQSYSSTMYKAALLNEKVKTAMLGDGVETYGIVARPDVFGCDLNADYNYTETSTKSYRYQAIFDLVY